MKVIAPAVFVVLLSVTVALAASPAAELVAEGRRALDAGRFDEALSALEFKCDVLWSILNSIHHDYANCR